MTESRRVSDKTVSLSDLFVWSPMTRFYRGRGVVDQFRKWLNKDLAWAGGLFLLVLTTRAPFRSHILYHWDSINFAYSIHEFDVAREQPHPPGYIAYVGLMRLIHMVVGDAQTTMVGMSIFASGLAVVMLFYLGRSMFSRRVGGGAALFLTTSPLFWFYGEIALPHTLDTLLVILTVWCLYEAMQGKRSYFVFAVIALSIAGGIRQQTLVFLLPLVMVSLYKVRWQVVIPAGLLGIGICLGWFVPLVSLSGGLTNYLDLMQEYSVRFQNTTSVLMGGGWWGVQRNLVKFAMYTLYGWGAAILPILYYVVTQIRRENWPQGWQRSVILLIWVIPAVAFYLLVHMGQQGLVFIFLPALLLISGATLSHLAGTRRSWLLLLTLLVGLNTSIFYFAPEYPLGDQSRIRLLTRSTLIRSDTYYQDRLDVIRSQFDSAATIILATNWHHVRYYLPQYTVLPFSMGSKWEANENMPVGWSDEIWWSPLGDLTVTDGGSDAVTVVIFDPVLEPFNRSSEKVRTVPLAHGEQIAFIVAPAAAELHVRPGAFAIVQDASAEQSPSP